MLTTEGLKEDETRRHHQRIIEVCSCSCLDFVHVWTQLNETFKRLNVCILRGINCSSVYMYRICYQYFSVNTFTFYVGSSFLKKTNKNKKAFLFIFSSSAK